MSQLDEIIQKAKYLIIDDEINNIRILEIALRQWGCENIRSSTESNQAVPLFQDYGPDLIMLDLNMPGIDGFGVMEQLQPLIPAGSYTPILVLTSDATAKTKRKALAAGARDFLTKPFDTNEFFLRVSNLLETRAMQQEAQRQQQQLEAAQRDLIDRLARAVVLNEEQQALSADGASSHHGARVGRIAMLLAEVLQLPPVEAGLIGQAAVLHDIGRLGIGRDIALKAAALSPEEIATMRLHTTFGANLLAGSDTPLLQLAEQIARGHHEHWDGGGYPAGLKGEVIPFACRIVAVAEAFDVMTHQQPYRQAGSVADAVAEIQKQSGRQFDPKIVEAFAILPHRILV